MQHQLRLREKEEVLKLQFTDQERQRGQEKYKAAQKHGTNNSKNVEQKRKNKENIRWL